MLLLVLTLVAILPAPWVARWLLAPVHRIGQRPAPRTTYGVLDLGALVVYLAVAAALVRFWSRRALADPLYQYLLMLLVGIFVAATWWLGLRALSAAGVREPPRRGAFLAIAVPLAYAGSAALAVAIVHMLLSGGRVPGVYDAVLLVLLAVGLFLSREVATWVAARPRSGAG